MQGGAAVLYPNHTIQFLLNVKDSINITYATTWPKVNVTVLCGIPGTNPFYYNAPDNPLDPNGTYMTTDFDDMGLNMNTYPRECYISLTKYKSNETFDGDKFTVTSTDIAPRTFAISSTAGITTTTSAALTTGTTSQVTISSSPHISESAGPTGAISAAIGIGVTLGVLIIITAVFIWVSYMRRRRKRSGNLFSVVDKTHYEKAELYSESIPRQHLHNPRSLDGMEKYSVGIQAAEKDALPASLPRFEMPGVFHRSDSSRHELA